MATESGRRRREYAPRVPAESAGPLLQRLGEAGVSLSVAHRLVVEDERTALRPVFGGADVPVEPSLVVWHQQRVSVDGLRRATADAERTDSLTVIGDCITPRRISHAIAEGYRTGATV